MLQFKIKETLLAAGKQFPAKWLRMYCDLTEAKAYNLVNDRQKAITLADLSIICQNLNCTPNDLLYWKETPSSRLTPTHPLMVELKQPDKLNNWFDVFKKLTPDKVIELHESAMEKLNNK